MVSDVGKQIIQSTVVHLRIWGNRPNMEENLKIRDSRIGKSGMPGLLLKFPQIIYGADRSFGGNRMEPKGKLKVPTLSPYEIRSQSKRQTSNEELEEVRKRGRYIVLPPVEEGREGDWEDLIL